MAASSKGRDREVTHRLEARQVFDSLAEDEARDGHSYRVYAHHMARACWHGSRIMLRQTSPEAESIFDFILELQRACKGQWTELRNRGVEEEEIEAWLEFAGMFLSSLGNHFDDGNRKVIPHITEDALRKMASISPEANARLEQILEQMMAPQPAHLGYPGASAQSGYYPGLQYLTKEEIAAVSQLMETAKIALENTRLRKYRSIEWTGSEPVDRFEILQASAETDPESKFLGHVDTGAGLSSKVFLRRGDHREEMAKICAELAAAHKIAATDEQKRTLCLLIESFQTGNYEAFRAAHNVWVKDKAPRVEHCMGFLFGYRDPYGARAEWQAASGIAHSEETRKMGQVVARSAEFIRTLPWAVADVNDGKGPFEPSELDVPDFAIIHVLASVSSTVWEATNITLDDEDGRRHGVKNMVYGNRISLVNPDRPCFYIHPSETEAYKDAAHIIRTVGTAIHELLGHGTGKLLAEIAPGKFNFDHEKPPVSPLTGEPVATWYRPGETWNSVFGKLAPTVEECRAFLIASYLADNKDILALFGYDDRSTPIADDLIYYAYLQIGVEGLRALRNFNFEDQSWGGDHDQAQFAIFKHLLQDSDGFIWVEHEPAAKTLFVRIDRSKIESHGKPSIGRMLCKIHIWHSTADVNACRPFYDALSKVDGEYETWRQIVAANKEPRWKFVQPNTFLKDDGTVELREYESSNVGIIQSFLERDL